MPYVYILTNKPLGTLYTGFTNDLARRIEAHKSKVVDGFTREHDLTLLVWHEFHENVIEARTRERLIKKWHRDWKIDPVCESGLARSFDGTPSLTLPGAGRGPS